MGNFWPDSATHGGKARWLVPAAVLCLVVIVVSEPRFQPLLVLLSLAGLQAVLALHWRERSRGWCRLFLVLGSTLLALCLLESWCLSKDRQKIVSTSKYQVYSERLGYEPLPGASATVRKTIAGKLLYEVDYSFDQQGLRIHPQFRQQGARNVLFFGDSYVLGEGVAAADSLPAQLERVAQGALACHNFGFHGYGPHQMLARLSDRSDTSVTPPGSTELVVHISLFPDHVERLMGRTTWDFQGPAYRLENGQLRHRGPFRARWQARLTTLFRRPALVKRLSRRPARPPDETDLATYVAALQACDRLVRERIPGARFLVIVWVQPSAGEEIVERLRGAGLNVVSIADILPRRHEPEFSLHKHDSHPSARAYEALARYLWEHAIDGPALNAGKEGSGKPP